jgi:prepilin-type N-terminal cleavage/methylation domain-containing protein
MRRGFTLLELLACTALTALLMLAILKIVASLGASRAALARQPQVQPWRADLLDTLRRDLTNASLVSFQAGGLTLVSHASLDPGDLTLGHQPSTVVYGLTTLGGRSWLVRRQSSRDTLSSTAPFAELLCPDVTAFSVRPATALVTTADAVPVPPVVTVSIDGPSGSIVDDQTLVLR